MDRAQYIQIRKSQDLTISRFALLTHYLREVIFVAAIYGVWNGFADSNLKFIAVPLLAALIFRNFSLMHDAVHRAVSKSQYINDLSGVISGSICLLPFEPWRKSHLEHHSWSGNIDKDPVMGLVKGYPHFDPKLQKTLNFFWRLWVPTLAVMQYGLFYLLATKIFIAKRDSLKVLLSLLSPLLLWGSLIYFLPTAFTLTILFPAFLLYMIAVEVVNFPHHLQLPQFEGDVRFPVWEQYKTSRSCIYPLWFAQHIVLNFNYHIEHHMFPDVPWYHLPKLHQEIKLAIGSDYNTDPSFGWIIENRPKNLEDVVCYHKAAAEEPKRTVA